MAETPPRTCKTRFVCISDTHNASPHEAFKLPKGDVLIHAGDMTNQGSFSELQKSVKWIEDADFEAKIVVAGNHDITLDTNFYNQYAPYFHNQNPQDADLCRNLLEKSQSILYLKHEAVQIRLTSSNGPRTSFKVFGSPYSPAKGMWAFSYDLEEAADIWRAMPLDSDVVITHTPPKYHRDERRDRRAAGCEELRRMLWRARPRLAVCGHVHESRGAEIVKWDLGSSNHKYKESGVDVWTDPGKDNNKISLVNLRQVGGRSLLNDGSIGDVHPDGSTDEQAEYAFSQDHLAASSAIGDRSQNVVQDAFSRMATSLLALPRSSAPSATRGQGGTPPSRRCDLDALSGRLGRKETCIVNAAIMASSWPHKGEGGKKFNKPIVVDIDLPVWLEDE